MRKFEMFDEISEAKNFAAQKKRKKNSKLPVLTNWQSASGKEKKFIVWYK